MDGPTQGPTNGSRQEPAPSGTPGAESDAAPAAAAGPTAAPPGLPPKGRKRHRSAWQKALSRYLGFLLLSVARAVLSRLPLPVGRALARLLGSAAYFVTPSIRRIAIDNLTHAFGQEKSAAEIRTIARRSYQSVALTVVEWLIIGRWSRERVARTFPDATATLDRLAADVRGRGSGGIGITAHCGNWEVLSYIFAVCDPGFLVPVANRVYYEKYQDFVHRQRAVFGTDVIYTDESPRRMIRAVHEGRLPSYLPDQEVRTNSGVFVDFFGRPAYTSPFPVQLARKLGVPMVLAILFREGATFRTYYSGLIDVPRTDDEKADILAGTQAWTRLLEEQIRRDPAQWAWVHPRWRATPDRPRTKLRGRGKKAPSSPEERT